MRQRWQLMMLDARALADIGIDRADAETECPITARSKRLCRATLGFKSMKTAYATLKRFEVMRMIHKRQCILLEPGVIGEVRLVNKLFDFAA